MGLLLLVKGTLCESRPTFHVSRLSSRPAVTSAHETDRPEAGSTFFRAIRFILRSESDAHSVDTRPASGSFSPPAYPYRPLQYGFAITSHSRIPMTGARGSKPARVHHVGRFDRPVRSADVGGQLASSPETRTKNRTATHCIPHVSRSWENRSVQIWRLRFGFWDEEGRDAQVGSLLWFASRGST